jgi:hypothetical protein
MISRKITKITGIALTVIGLSVFAISYNQGSIAQYKFSDLGCAVNFTPKMCAETNAVIVAGFIGMILSFFTALFGASLVMSSVLAKMLGKVRRIKVEK